MLTDRPIPGHITGLYVFTVLNLLILLNVSLVNGDVTVLKKNETIAIFEDMEAMFGPNIPDNGILGRLVYVTPHNACHPVKPPPELQAGSEKVAWIALVARDDCDFALKVLNAQSAQYDMAIVHNSYNNDELVRMGGGTLIKSDGVSDCYGIFQVYNVQSQGYQVAIVHNFPGRDELVPMGGNGSRVQIPSVFVGYTSGMNLARDYNYTNRHVFISIDNGLPHWDYKMYLWPFAIVIGTCFCLMVVFMIAKWCRDVRRRQRSRLSKKHLKKIPIKKFKKGDYYDVCAICLDDYEEGDKMRVLPCSHAYHSKCIDPWLLKNKKTCPVCKRRVMPGRDAESDSDSEEENGNNPDPSESTPLLGGQSRSSPSRRSTFDTSGLPEVVREEATQSQGSGSHESEEDNESVGSEDGAVGGAVTESVEVVVENDNTRNVNTNYGFSSDEDVNISGDKAKQTRELNQVV